MSRTLLKDAQGGFLSFREVMHSDHRAVWIDIRAKHVGMVYQEKQSHGQRANVLNARIPT